MWAPSGCKTDIAIFRPEYGLWAQRWSSDGTDHLSTFGIDTDIPVPADYDGDGVADYGVYRPAAGTWFLHHSSDATDEPVAFGISTDIPVPGDYNADAIADPAVYRDGQWFTEPGINAAWASPATSRWRCPMASGGPTSRSVVTGRHQPPARRDMRRRGAVSA